MRKIYFQNKHKGANQNKVYEAKTVENIKYEQTLRTQGHIIHIITKLEFEKWVKIPHRE